MHLKLIFVGDTIQLSYPDYYLLLAGVIALGYGLFLYWRNKKIGEERPWLPAVLGIIRTLAVFGILFFLLGPVFKNLFTQTEDPLILIAEDRSSSVRLVNPEKADSVAKNFDILSDQLKGNYKIQRIGFGEQITTDIRDTTVSMSTNMSAVMTYIADNFSNQNLGAVIIASDGIYNEGRNPLYIDADIKAPVYTVALGDTSVRKDILIKNVLHNRIAYLNDKFIIEVDVQAFNGTGERSRVTINEVKVDGKVQVGTQSFTIDRNNYFRTFAFEAEAKTVGNVKYEVIVGRVANELSTQNNYKSLYMEVLDGRQKILIAANATHPDIGALKRVINRNKNYEAETWKVGDPLPQLAAYDVCILHNLPSVDADVNWITSSSNQNLALIFILGGQVSVQAFNQVQDILSISGQSSSLNDVQPIFNNNFTAFNYSESFPNEIEKMLPLKCPFGEYSLGSASQTVLYQKIGSVETTFPLLAVNSSGRAKKAVLTGEGYWRWRLFEYAQKGTQEYSGEMINKLIQFVSQKEDKRKFRAYVNRNVFKENEDIIFDAQLYNDNYQLVNGPEAFLTVRNSEGEDFTYTLSKVQDAYNLNVGRFPEGNYQFFSRTNLSGQEYKSSGSFLVQSIQKEQYDLTARHDLLFALSQKYNGMLFYEDQIGAIPDSIQANNFIRPVLYQRTETKSLLNVSWILLIVLFLLASEWFLRRYFGHY